MVRASRSCRCCSPAVRRPPSWPIFAMRTSWPTGRMAWPNCSKPYAERRAARRMQMIWKVLIAHEPSEEALAERLAEPIRGAGYEVVHRGTVAVGDSIELETTVALESGGPVVLCGTQRAVGSRWAWQLV